MIKISVVRNPKTRKFQCVIPIMGRNKTEFLDASVTSRFIAKPFLIWFKEENDAEIHKVVIIDKKPESGTIETTDRWIIKGYFIENEQKFEGYYNTKTCSGHISFID